MHREKPRPVAVGGAFSSCPAVRGGLGGAADTARPAYLTLEQQFAFRF